MSDDAQLQSDIDRHHMERLVVDFATSKACDTAVNLNGWDVTDPRDYADRLATAAVDFVMRVRAKLEAAELASRLPKRSLLDEYLATVPDDEANVPRGTQEPLSQEFVDSLSSNMFTSDDSGTPPTNVENCSRCNKLLMFSARKRGNGLCGPCTRLAAAERTADARSTDGSFSPPGDVVDMARDAGVGLDLPEPSSDVEVDPEHAAELAGFCVPPKGMHYDDERHDYEQRPRKLPDDRREWVDEKCPMSTAAPTYAERACRAMGMSLTAEEIEAARDRIENGDVDDDHHRLVPRRKRISDDNTVEQYGDEET
jgi:hypothetical protein